MSKINLKQENNQERDDANRSESNLLEDQSTPTVGVGDLIKNLVGEDTGNPMSDFNSLVISASLRGGQLPPLVDTNELDFSGKTRQPPPITDTNELDFSGKTRQSPLAGNVDIDIGGGRGDGGGD